MSILPLSIEWDAVIFGIILALLPLAFMAVGYSLWKVAEALHEWAKPRKD